MLCLGINRGEALARAAVTGFSAAPSGYCTVLVPIRNWVNGETASLRFLKDQNGELPPR